MYYLTMDFPALRMLVAGLHRGRSHGFVKAYPPTYYAIHFSYSGRFSMRRNGETRVWTGPVLWTGYPGLSLQFKPLDEPDNRVQDFYFGMTGALVERWVEDGIFPREPVQVARFLEARNAAREVLTFSSATDAIGQQLLANAVSRLLLIGTYRPEPVEIIPQWLRDVEHRLLYEPSWQPRWDHIARHHRVPLSTFRKRFIALTGKPPQRWVIEKRIARARELLAEGASVRNVAEQLGYSDVFFFSRQFREWTGIAPSAYAKLGVG
jgi:AraC-like DNA-binding protein